MIFPKVVINGGTGEGCDIPDLLKRDLPETHFLVELLTHIDNLFPFLNNLFTRRFSHLMHLIISHISDTVSALPLYAHSDTVSIYFYFIRM